MVGSSLKRRLPLRCAALGAIPFLFSCGGHASSGGGDAPKPHVGGDVDAATLYHLSLATANGQALKLTDASGAPVQVTWQLSIDGAQATSGAAATMDALRAALAGVTVRGGSILDFSLTLATGAGKVLATNVSADAAKDAVTKAIWQSSCSSVGTSLSVLDQAKVVNGSDLLALDVPLCDFASVLVAPTITVTPVNPVVTNFETVFECTNGNYNGYFNIDHLLYSSDPSESQCFVGYTRPRHGALVTVDYSKDAQGAEIAIVAPKNSEATPYTIDTGSGFVDAIKNRPASRRFELTDAALALGNFGNLGFASARNCYALEIQAMYKDAEAAAAGTVKEARMTWKRSLDADHNLTWVPDDQTVMPTAELIHAAAQTTNRYWLHCKWENPKGYQLGTVVAKDGT